MSKSGAGAAADRHPREVARAAGGEEVEDGRAFEARGDLAVGDLDGAERHAGRELGEGRGGAAAVGLGRLDQPFVGAEAEGAAGALGGAGADRGRQREAEGDAGGAGSAVRSETRVVGGELGDRDAGGSVAVMARLSIVRR